MDELYVVSDKPFVNKLGIIFIKISHKSKRVILKLGVFTLPSLYPYNNPKCIGLKPCGFNVLIAKGVNLVYVVYLPGETLAVGN